ncbi:MAG: Holliday junction branch migration protein RuvA [Anaerolineales bacterium]|uniref:Holliday junction branch migration complex subunit RuvA n=1 Tax=Candidatus Desulfolinea nitratireducens TaxID=2841698 RepID=A0A8J6TDQ4_9CHLR|nr:Holliday junction branch migration protein RuvA [Candidatus Desulfolinea nitratireducens]MBL6960451.1 Holliday junction branch migration protein RuvA [Anaerolineales bacterium]
MIATLRGEITQIEDTSLVVEVGGIGMRVHVPATLRERMKVGESILLYTHFVVRQDAMSLYGFESQGERDLYNMLLSVNGVGPKLALAVLSSLSLDTVQRAVFNEEYDILNRVPGVGKKTAQRIVLSLQDKLKPLDALEQVAAMSDTDGEVLAALTALGYSVVEAQTAIQAIPKDAPKDVEERLRLALGYFQ